MSPSTVNTPTTPNVRLPPGLLPNFSMPPPMMQQDTDIRIFPGTQQQHQMQNLPWSVIRPMNGSSSDGVHSNSDVPIPGVEDDYGGHKPANFDGSRRPSFNTDHKR
uniref:Uncharacterized protein n=1 Tax=Acrobeloides nanus TaxID=290746 RepID=A0A914BUG6_9BILA